LEDLEGDTQKIVELLQILVTATQRGHWRSREVEHAKKILGELVADQSVSVALNGEAIGSSISNTASMFGIYFSSHPA
jgi:hypothetical protein